MTISNGYTTLDELRYHIDPQGGIVWSDSDLPLQELAIEAASRWIDNQTGRTFYTVADTRYYDAQAHDSVTIDDVVTVTAVKTDGKLDRTYGDVFASADYELIPRNAAQKNRPYTEIRTTPNGSYSFSTYRDSVSVSGTFGYASEVPSDISAACLILAHQLWKRKAAIFGVMGMSALGVQVVMKKITHDAHVMGLIMPYKRIV